MARSSGFCLVTICIRAAAAIMQIAAIIVLIFAKGTHQCSYQPRFHYWTAFRFYVGINAVACLYNGVVFSIPSGSRFWDLIMVIDAAAVAACMGSFAAAANTVNLLTYGTPQVGIFPMCNVISPFCTYLITSLCFGGLGFMLNLGMLLYALVILMNQGSFMSNHG